MEGEILVLNLHSMHSKQVHTLKIHSFIYFTFQKSKSGNTAFGYETSQNTTAKHNTGNTSHKNTIHNNHTYKTQFPRNINDNFAIKVFC
jgi:hypothetical protein